MRCGACFSLLLTPDVIQFLKDDRRLIIIVGKCPNCGPEAVTDPFIPAFVEPKKGWLFTTPGDEYHEQFLHTFAQELLNLGLERFARTPVPHYTLTPGQREEALQAGAVPLDETLFLKVINDWRHV